MKELFLVFYSAASGVLVSAGVFAFIAAIGIVPRMAWRTGTRQYIRLYEDAIVLGGLWGTTAMFVDYCLPSWGWLTGLFALMAGVFIGVLAMALTEVLNVMLLAQCMQSMRQRSLLIIRNTKKSWLPSKI